MTTRKPSVNAIPVSVKLGVDERTRLAALAETRKRTPHYLMREAVSEYLGREEARQSFRKEASRAWQAYKETGLHATHEEVDAWIESLGARKRKRQSKWRK
ncbi:MAG TPA: ribbon-helix-helix protein, CopG family [Reyranella sp.]|nr:ribbon-helix-helix protein, CopG family [Reyranella sp.]